MRYNVPPPITVRPPLPEIAWANVRVVPVGLSKTSVPLSTIDNVGRAVTRIDAVAELEHAAADRRGPGVLRLTEDERSRPGLDEVAASRNDAREDRRIPVAADGNLIGAELDGAGPGQRAELYVARRDGTEQRIGQAFEGAPGKLHVGVEAVAAASLIVGDDDIVFARGQGDGAAVGW